MSEELIKRLWESDAASALTNEAARKIEELEQKLRTTSLEALAIIDTNNELQARLSEAVKVLEPFARYLDEHKFDIDNKGNLLPDETQPGWTYLTAGDFRAAKAFIATLWGRE